MGRPSRRAGVAVLEEDVAFAQFFFEHLLPNRPAIVRGATSRWGAQSSWCTPDGEPDFDWLENGPLAAATVPVDSHNGGGNCSRTSLTLAEFVAKWRADLSRAEATSTDDTASAASDAGWLYLKDWHFARDCPADAAGAYTPLAALGPDWLNAWWLGPRSSSASTSHAESEEQPAADSTRTPPDDFRFVYAGPRGSWTPLHHDVLCSHSWSANLCGRKRWLLFPPSVSPWLHSEDSAELLADARPERAAALPERERRRYPRLERALRAAIDVVQQPGELLFVPSGWHHQVLNLDDVLSINHNWLNAACLRSVARFLASEAAAVRAALASLRKSPGCAAQRDDASLMEPPEWASRCEALMEANCGMGLREFIRMLGYHVDAAEQKWRGDELSGQECDSATGTASPPVVRAADWAGEFELRQVRHVLRRLLREEPRHGEVEAGVEAELEAEPEVRAPDDIDAPVVRHRHASPDTREGKHLAEDPPADSAEWHGLARRLLRRVEQSLLRLSSGGIATERHWRRSWRMRVSNGHSAVTESPR